MTLQVLTILPINNNNFFILVQETKIILRLKLLLPGMAKKQVCRLQGEICHRKSAAKAHNTS